MNNLKQSIREIAMADNSIVSSPQMGTVKQQIAECAVRILSKESPLHRKEIFRRMTEEEGVIVGGKYPLDKMSAYLFPGCPVHACREGRVAASGAGRNTGRSW